MGLRARSSASNQFGFVCKNRHYNGRNVYGGITGFFIKIFKLTARCRFLLDYIRSYLFKEMLRVKLTISLTSSAAYQEGDQKYQHHGPVQIIKTYHVQILLTTKFGMVA